MVAMRSLPVVLLRLPLLVAIAASAALLVEYTNAGDPAFCGVLSGCFAVRVSPYSRIVLGGQVVPLPALGLTAYALLFGLTLVARKRIQHASVGALSALGGLIAIWLLWLQKTEIGAFCQWCVAVDISAIVAAVTGPWVALRAWKDEASVLLPSRPRVTYAWVAAATIAIIAPFLWGRYPVEPPLPAAVAAEQQPGVVTIVGFTDFECPFCRRMHPVLRDVVERSSGKVRLVRHMMPLSGHPGAEPAALVYLCTPEPLREAVADKLYAAPPVELTPEGTIAIAAQAGADANAVGECTRSKETRAKLEADKKLFDELGGRGLPFTFVGRRVVLGFNPDRVTTAIAQETGGERMSLPVWAMFVLLAVVFLSAIVVTLVTPPDEQGASVRA